MERAEEARATRKEERRDEVDAALCMQTLAWRGQEIERPRVQAWNSNGCNCLVSARNLEYDWMLRMT